MIPVSAAQGNPSASKLLKSSSVIFDGCFDITLSPKVANISNVTVAVAVAVVVVVVDEAVRASLSCCKVSDFYYFCFLTLKV
jgi:hypothetical protein